MKSAAQGRWMAILAAAGIPVELLDGRDHPCPKCNGRDRFGAAKDVAHTGKVFCRKCFKKESNPPPGDGVATIAWWRGQRNGEAAKWIAEHLGMNAGEAGHQSADIVAEVARDKNIPVEALSNFGPKAAKRGRQKTTVARVPVYNERGEIHSYFDLAPGEKGRFRPGQGSSGLFFPGRLPEQGETWLLVEGVKDSAALVGLGFHAAGLPSSAMPAKFARLFEGVDVICVPDLDTAGQAGAQRTGGNLSGIAASIKIARLPGEIRESSGDDVRDVLRRPDGERLVREAIDNAVEWVPGVGLANGVEKPQVVVTLDEAAVADQVVERLGALGWTTPWLPKSRQEAVRVFSRGGSLVRTIASEDPTTRGQLTIAPLPPSILRERITQACQLVTESESHGEVKLDMIRPPKWLIDSVHQRGHFNGHVRPLTGIIEAPTIRQDGTILQSPGYDVETGLLYRPTVAFPKVPDAPTQHDAQQALTKLMEPLVDFPMVDDADRSAWACMVLSMIGRSCVSGCVPLFAITANIRGAGKSLLVDAASIIAYGRPAARQAFTRDDDEMRKLITTIAREGTLSVLFDNLDVQLGGASLDAALTSSEWEGRVLGQSRSTGKLPMRTVWAATGNNMAFGSDIARRVLPIRLQSPLESPEDRVGFNHPDLLGWVTDNRPQLAIAALTILRAYFVANRPIQPGGQWGSFESWTGLIRGAVVWAGATDPLPAREAATANDDAKSLLGSLIAGLEEADPYGEGLTSAEIGSRTGSYPGEGLLYPVLTDAVHEVCGERFNSKQFGRRMRTYVGRVYQGRMLEATAGHGGVKRWRVRQVDIPRSPSGAGDHAVTEEAASKGQLNQPRLSLESTHLHDQFAQVADTNVNEVSPNSPTSEPVYGEMVEL